MRGWFIQPRAGTPPPNRLDEPHPDEDTSLSGGGSSSLSPAHLPRIGSTNRVRRGHLAAGGRFVRPLAGTPPPNRLDGPPPTGTPRCRGAVRSASRRHTSPESARWTASDGDTCLPGAVRSACRGTPTPRRLDRALAPTPPHCGGVTIAEAAPVSPCPAGARPAERGSMRTRSAVAATRSSAGERRSTTSSAEVRSARVAAA